MHNFNSQIIVLILDNNIVNNVRISLRFIEFSFEKISYITNITI